LTEGWIEAV